MFAVIYRAYLHPATEAVYQQQWHKVTHCGALGSCLHKTEEGYWLAYSRWPNKAARDRAWPGENAPADIFPDDISKAIIEIQRCLPKARKFPEICMEIIDDLLVKN